MGTRERKKRERADLRERVIAAARAIMIREGFGALTIRRIAEAIEYAPSTLYLYFRDRDEIAAELCAREFASLFEHLATSSATPDPLERLRVLAKAYLEFALENPEAYRLAFMGEPKYVEAVLKMRGSRSDEKGEGALSLAAIAIEELRASGRLESARSSRVLADTMWVGLHGIASLKIAYPKYAMSETTELLDSLLESLFHGLIRRAPRAR